MGLRGSEDSNWILILMFNEKRLIGWFGLSDVIVSGMWLVVGCGCILTLHPGLMLNTANLQAAVWSKLRKVHEKASENRLKIYEQRCDF